MQTVNIEDAKAHFPELLDHVLDGETVLITREGVTVAELVPAPKPGGGLVLGSGIGDPNVNWEVIEKDEWWQPITDEEVEDILEGRS